MMTRVISSLDDFTLKSFYQDIHESTKTSFENPTMDSLEKTPPDSKTWENKIFESQIFPRRRWITCTQLPTQSTQADQIKTLR